MARTRIVVPTAEQEAKMKADNDRRLAESRKIAEEYEAKQVKLAQDREAERARIAALPPHPMQPTSTPPRRRLPGQPRELGDRTI